jgi:hypothetical protein
MEYNLFRKGLVLAVAILMTTSLASVLSKSEEGSTKENIVVEKNHSDNQEAINSGKAIVNVSVCEWYRDSTGSPWYSEGAYIKIEAIGVDESGYTDRYGKCTIEIPAPIHIYRYYSVSVRKSGFTTGLKIIKAKAGDSLDLRFTLHELPDIIKTQLEKVNSEFISVNSQAINFVSKSSQQQESNELTTIQKDGTPDLIIKKADYAWRQDGQPGWFVLFVLNDGDGEVPKGPRKEVVTVYFDYLMLLFRGYYRSEKSHNHHESHPPGTVDWYLVPEFGQCGLLDVIRIFFWVNPEKEIEESDYENNGIWAYYKTEKRDEDLLEYVRISDFYQWKTDGSPPWGRIANIDFFQNCQTTQQHTTQQTASYQTQSSQQSTSTIIFSSLVNS